jgi:tetratricopeptide (TPR) repeat protein
VIALIALASFAVRADEMAAINSNPRLAPAPSTVAIHGTDDVDALVKQGLAAEAKLDPRTALVFFRQADAAKPNDPVILQKISQQLSDSTAIAATKEEKQRLATEALGYAQRALALAPKNAVNVLSVAICYGKLALYAGTRVKVENSRLVKRYADEALALDPNSDWAHHVIGRWHYEVATLGLADRLALRLVYGGLPPASLDEAVAQFKRAVELAPAQPSHHIELAFALLAAGRKADARREFQLGLDLPALEIHDAGAKDRARAALAKLK